MKRSLRSYEKNVAEHIDKLANPAKHEPNWYNLPPREQEGLKNVWEKHLRIAQELARIAREILIRERGISP